MASFKARPLEVEVDADLEEDEEDVEGDFRELPEWDMDLLELFDLAGMV